MGLEYITQPQVFLGGLTALGPGIEGLTENYPLLTTYYSWTSTASVNTSSFPIPIDVGSIYNGPNNSGSFIVSVGGVVQSPTEYTVDPILRTITFNSIITAGIEFAATQLATASPSSQSFDFVKSVSAEFLTLSAQNIISENIDYTGSNITVTNLLVTNLTALSSELRVVDITQYEISGFDVQGNATINGTVSATGTMVIDTSSSNAALRVTQRGSTGNAIEVEDSANPDSTPFVVNSTGAVGIGTNSPSYRLDLQNNSNSVQGMRIYNPNTSGSARSLLQFGNDLNGAAAALLLNSSTNSSFGSGSLILTHGLAYPIIFATSNTERMRIADTGQVSISGLPAPGQALTVVGDISASGKITVTTPILSTDNSTQVATTNFVRQFGGYQGAVTYTSGTGTVDLSSLGEGIQKIKVTVVGGGGAGGGSGAAIGAVGSGGGSGGVTIKYINNVTQLGNSFTYIIGVGGTGGTGAGGTGSTSAFILGTTSVSANGGTGGNFGVANVHVVGGSGASASTTGDINIPGTPGNKATATAAVNTASSGEGGSNMFGGGGLPVRNTANLPGNSGAINTGAGGSGGAANTAVNNNGGNGGSGIIIVEY